ncbi:MAG: hypothetical protein WCK05_12420 [Planctomycetota bacterium]
MPTPKRIRADAARLGIQTIRTVADGRAVQIARGVCAACQGHDELRQSPGTPAETLQATFEARGWTGFGHRPLCPACSRTTRKSEDTRMLPRQKITKAAMDQMPAPTPRQVVTIADALAEHLDDGRYRPGWSDHRIGDDLKLPAALVAKVREDLHGPLKGDPEIDALRGDLDAWISIGADLRGRLDRLEQTRA